ncbi:3D (Asp-Asp-Asp) domain-containing protein [Marinirhabdus gelatinilytica]|uniref:3D (Asp-Asp-Asp) domain-containing protein n=2 Tax=Marinirhabdus gelatinilytica TaxID=1703343 RepID=A0A370QB80_9FLAO|nr:3D (Asp-Asp-Asp) domain-containing protein [Marinirhabdus gelatinilytica]
MNLISRNILVPLVSVLFMTGCENNLQSSYVSAEKNTEKTITVTATAYNSVERQTKKGNPSLAAWGDILVPGERAIAVSRDLIKKGLDHNEEVEIKGMPGIYVVKDKMNKRWKNKIDIYMGLNEKAARNWGKRTVELIYNPKNKEGKFDKLQQSL